MSAELTFERLANIVNQLGDSGSSGSYAIPITKALHNYIEDIENFHSYCMNWSRKRKMKWYRRRMNQMNEQEVVEVTTIPKWSLN